MSLPATKFIPSTSDDIFIRFPTTKLVLSIFSLELTFSFTSKLFSAETNVGIVNNVIKSDLYNLLTSDQEIQALTNLLKSEINGALKEIINSKVKKMTDGISASLNTPIPDAYYEALATQYGVTFEQAKAIAGTAQLDMANNIKKTLSNINVADEIINELNNKEYLSNLVKTYSTKINEHLKIAIGSDEKINAMIKDIKEKVMTAIKSDLSKDNIYLNDEVKKLISDTVNQIINDILKTILIK